MSGLITLIDEEDAHYARVFADAFRAAQELQRGDVQTFTPEELGVLNLPAPAPVGRGVVTEVSEDEVVIAGMEVRSVKRRRQKGKRET